MPCVCVGWQDPFGAGMRVSTKYAYRGGKLCATIALPNPASGTIFGMYLIDVHPKGVANTLAEICLPGLTSA